MEKQILLLPVNYDISPLLIVKFSNFNELVPITTEVVSSNPVHGNVYSMQHYVIKFVGEGSVVSSANKTDLNDITEILLKVMLNTINQINQISVLSVKLELKN